MLEGNCPNCGSHYYGWALRNPRNQMCRSCGTALVITDEGGRTLPGFSPFEAENVIKPPPDLSSTEENQDGIEKTDTV